MAAEKGNQYALGNDGGRPPMYESPEEMLTRIEEYFESIKPIIKFKKVLEPEDYTKGHKPIYNGDRVVGYQIMEREPKGATVTGLSLFLGFASRNTLYEYAKKDEFKDILKMAQTRVENSYELELYNGKPTGAIFALKNMGWKDKTEQEVTNTMAVTWNEQKTYDSNEETD